MRRPPEVIEYLAPTGWRHRGSPSRVGAEPVYAACWYALEQTVFMRTVEPVALMHLPGVGVSGGGG
jgi:hypothetical protein